MLKVVEIVESSHLKQVYYDQTTMQLFITFAKGETYLYKGVPEDVVNDLSRSLSAGQHFEAFIKDGFESEKIGINILDTPEF